MDKGHRVNELYISACSRPVRAADMRMDAFLDRRPAAMTVRNSTTRPHSRREINMSIEVEWARMTAPDLRAIAAREGALAILPAGSLEQHGPHLPVITDTASASAASIAAARLVAAEAVPVAVLPGLWLGVSEHHFACRGTL